MTDQQEPMFVAKLRNGNFTRTGTVAEILTLLDKLIPVEAIYVVVPLEDNSGFVLKQAGVPYVDIAVEGNPTPKTSSPEAPSATISDQPIPTPSPDRDSPVIAPNWTFDNGSEPDSFKFDRPKSQAELLKERGIEESPAISPSKPKAKRKSKAKPPTKSQQRRLKIQQEEDIPDDQLPKVVSLGSRTQINHISTATPLEAERASQFGKKS